MKQELKYFKYAFAESGDRLAIDNKYPSSGEVNYEQGFGPDYQLKIGVNSDAKAIPRDKTNQLYYDITSTLKQYQEQGFFNFITSDMNGGEPFSYSMGACVRFDMSEANDGSDVRNFSSKINDNKGNPKDNPNDWKDLNSGGGAASYHFTTITSSTTLTLDQQGIILIDASTGDLTITLPITDENINYILKRLDNSDYKVKVQANGTDKVKYNLAINPNGYNFFYLFGAGDYWQIVSDGKGSWFDIDREDKNKIGKIDFVASTLVPTGGYILADGRELSRTEYPFLWDYALKSGILIDETEKTGMDGCFTKGDGATTFRVPELRGEFLRVLDNGRGKDVDRIIGSWQIDELKAHNHLIAIDRPQVGWGTAYRSTVDSSKNTTDETASTGGNETRPRNIAYPAYIKII